MQRGKLGVAHERLDSRLELTNRLLEDVPEARMLQMKGVLLLTLLDWLKTAARYGVDWQRF